MSVLHGIKIYYLPGKNYYLGVNCWLLVSSFCGCQITAESPLVNKMLPSMSSPAQVDMCFPFKHFIAPTENKSAVSLGILRGEGWDLFLDKPEENITLMDEICLY